MTFDYLQSNLSTKFNDEIKGRFNEVFTKDVEERARLLFSLRVPLEQAVARINSDVEWEFDGTWTGGLPAVHKKTRKLVVGIYARLGG